VLSPHLGQLLPSFISAFLIFVLYHNPRYLDTPDINRTGNVAGVLLYAKTDEEISPDNSYLMDGNKIYVKTLDLDRRFEEIRNQLNKIVCEWEQSTTA